LERRFTSTDSCFFRNCRPLPLTFTRVWHCALLMRRVAASWSGNFICCRTRGVYEFIIFSEAVRVKKFPSKRYRYGILVPSTRYRYRY
jgi:hypothetical protein